METTDTTKTKTYLEIMATIAVFLSSVAAVVSAIAAIQSNNVALQLRDLAIAQDQFQHNQHSEDIRVSIGEIWENFFSPARNRLCQLSQLMKGWSREKREKTMTMLTSESIYLCLADSSGKAPLLDSSLGFREMIAADDHVSTINMPYPKFIKYVMDYRQTVLDGLNALETVQAIIDARRGQHDDNTALANRYELAIHNFSYGVLPFISAYRGTHPRGDSAMAIYTAIDTTLIDAWHNLTVEGRRLP